MTSSWITGAKGFIGQHLSKALRQRGIQAVGLGHGPMTEKEIVANGLAGWLNSSVTGTSLALLREQYGAPEVVFHVAGGSAVAPSLRAPHEDFARTVQSTAALLEWLRLESPNTALVYFSSAAVYGAAHREPISEKSVPSPYSPYGFHKYCAELLVQEYACNFGQRATILRLFSVYGPGLRKQLLWDIAQRLYQQPDRLVLGGTGEELRDWLYIDDAVALAIKAHEWATRFVPVINGGTGVATSVKETAEILSRELGHVITPTFTGEARAGDPAMLVADVRSAASLGFSPGTTVHAGMKTTAQWLREVIPS